MSGLMREILRTPLVKDRLREHLKNITVDGARSLVKTVLWQDLEVIFGVLGSLPAFINACSAAIGELAREVSEKLQPELVKGFVGSIMEDIDKDGLKDSIHAVATLFHNLLNASPELKMAAIEKGPRAIALVINACTTWVNALCREDPALMSAFVTDIIADIDKPALSEATLNLADAVLDQQLGLLAWSGRLLKRRLMKRLGRLAK